MPLTVGHLIDRVLRSWLLPPDDQPPRFTLTDDIDATTTTLPISPALLPPEVHSALSPGVIVELGQEHIILGMVTNGTVEGCIRGANGTTASPHPINSVAILSPPYARRTLYEAVTESILSISPPLYHLHSATLTTDTAPVEVPADYITPQSLIVLNGSAPLPARFRELPHYPPSSTGKAIIFEGVPSGLEAHLTYRTRFHPPESESDLLFENLGIEEEWQRIVEVDVVAQMIAGRDLDGLAVERLAAQIEAEGFPALTSTRIHQSLIRYHEYLLQRAHRHLLARDGVPQINNGRFENWV